MTAGGGAGGFAEESDYMLCKQGRLIHGTRLFDLSALASLPSAGHSFFIESYARLSIHVSKFRGSNLAPAALSDQDLIVLPTQGRRSSIREPTRSSLTVLYRKSGAYRNHTGARLQREWHP